MTIDPTTESNSSTANDPSSVSSEQRRADQDKLREEFAKEAEFFAEQASLPTSPDRAGVVEMHMLVQGHALEKGFAHENRRPSGFGQARAEQIAECLAEAEGLDGVDPYAVQIGTEACAADRGMKVEECSDDDMFGVQFVTADQMFAPVKGFAEFAAQRFSLRLYDYPSAPVTADEIKQAVEIAQTAPSACNRQCITAYWIAREHPSYEEIAKLQGGCEGFAENAAGMVALAADARVFTHDEYPYMFLDAGIFSLNLAYALQSLHIGSCLLNGALPYDKRIRAEALLGCKPSEHLGMFVLVSKIPEGKRALRGRAARKPIDQVFKLVE
jgi:nitroreductase